MKAARLLIAIGILVSSSAVAEPYAQWGVFADGTPLSEIDASVKMPSASDVPIPLAPGGVFVGGGGDSDCTIGIRSKQSVEQVCTFYRSVLDSSIYQRVEDLEIEGHPSCAIYEHGDVKNGAGVWVFESTDPLFVM
jgi:hypothetical protein